MIASPQPNPRDGSWGISDEWGRFRQLSLVESQPRWSDWHWSADSRLVRVNLDNIDEEEECGDRAVLEQDLQTLRDIRQEYLDLALKAKSKSRESELMLGVRDKDRQIAWVEGKLRELEGQRETFFHKKKEAEDFLRSDTPAAPPENEPENFLMENTPTFFHKKGRGKNKIPPSGTLRWCRRNGTSKGESWSIPESKVSAFTVTWRSTIPISLSGFTVGQSKIMMDAGRITVSQSPATGFGRSKRRSLPRNQSVRFCS